MVETMADMSGYWMVEMLVETMADSMAGKTVVWMDLMMVAMKVVSMVAMMVD